MISSLVLFIQIGDSPYRNYIQENLTEIQNRFKENRQQFVFLPAMREARTTEFDTQLQQYLEIYYPGYNLLSVEQQIQILYIISSTSGEQAVYSRLQEMFGFNLTDGAYLCHLLNGRYRLEELPSHFSPNEGIEKICPQFGEASLSLPDENGLKYFKKYQFYEEGHDIEDKISLIKKVESDPFERVIHFVDDAIIPAETQRLLDTVKALKLEEGLLQLIELILNKVGRDVPNVVNKLESTTEKLNRISINRPLGKIHFNYDGKLFLGEDEVLLNPICRALYKLFLNHPGGIELRNMSDHFEELHLYYRNFATHTEPATLIERVKMLCNPLDNSINEKISRINKAFKELLGEHSSLPYQILGVRGEAKKINIRSEFLDV